MDELDKQVESVMTDTVRTIREHESVRVAADVLTTERIGSVVVIGSSGRGILTKTDIVAGISEGIDPDHTSVHELATTDLITSSPDATLGEAVDVMADNSIKRVIVEEDGVPVGVLSSTDIMSELSIDLDEIVATFKTD